MALLQAILTLLGRSVSRILNAILGWAVVALFGRTSPREKTLLAALVAVAAAWPLLVVGVAFPRIAAFVIAFVPLHDKAPGLIVRVVWIVLAVAVPLVVGAFVAQRAPATVTGDLHESRWKTLLRGFPITIGIGAAFLFMFVTIPLLRLVSLYRRHRDEHLPLITNRHEYSAAAAAIDDVNRRFDLGVARKPPPWWLSVPSRLMLKLGGRALHAFTPPQQAFWESPQLRIALYSSDVLIRGEAARVAFAHAILAECFARGPGMSTYSAAAQDIEREIHQLWQVLDDEPAHVRSKRLEGRLGEIGLELARVVVNWDDWQVLYRKTMQLGRALHGHGQLLQSLAAAQQAEEKPMRRSEHDIPPLQTASTTELVAQLLRQSSDLVKTEVALARADIRNDVRRELKAAARGAAAAICALWTIDLLLVAAVLAVATALPAWAAALIVAGGMLALAVGVGGWAWMTRVEKPLQKTQRSLEENVRWAKERLA